MSHQDTTLSPERSLETDGGVNVFAPGASHIAESLSEQQKNMPVELCRALHISALPVLSDQVRYAVPGDDATSLQITFVAHNQNRSVAGAHDPVKQ